MSLADRERIRLHRNVDESHGKPPSSPLSKLWIIIAVTIIAILVMVFINRS